MNETPDVLNAIPKLEKDLPAETFMVEDFWIPVIWCVGIALLLAIAGLLIWRFYHKKPVSLPPSPMETAMAELSRLEEGLPSLRECSLRLSLVLRAFLTGQIQDPALFETHEEFSQRMDSLCNIPKACQLDTRRLLEELASLKYAGEWQENPSRARSLIGQVRELVIRIDDAQRKEAASAAELARVQKMS